MASGLSKFGAIDILVNNAGVALLEPALEVTESNWDKTLDVNLRAAFFLTRRIGSEMIKRGGGKIINLASQAGVVALERHVAYCASKAAMLSVTKVLALEWAKHNIQVNAIAPGWFPTDMSGKVIERNKKMLLTGIPAGRFGGPDDLKGAAVFLASDASNFVTGHTLVVDGGQSA